MVLVHFVSVSGTSLFALTLEEELKFTSDEFQFYRKKYGIEYQKERKKERKEAVKKF